MLEFNSREELQANEHLQSMWRYDWEKVKLNGKEVYACTTNQQYEDIIWGYACKALLEFKEHFNIDCDSENDFSAEDMASEVRDFILEQLERRYGIILEDVFYEY